MIYLLFAFMTCAAIQGEDGLFHLSSEPMDGIFSDYCSRLSLFSDDSRLLWSRPSLSVISERSLRNAIINKNGTRVVTFDDDSNSAVFAVVIYGESGLVLNVFNKSCIFDRSVAEAEEIRYVTYGYRWLDVTYRYLVDEKYIVIRFISGRMVVIDIHNGELVDENDRSEMLKDELLALDANLNSALSLADGSMNSKTIVAIKLIRSLRLQNKYSGQLGRIAATGQVEVQSELLNGREVVQSIPVYSNLAKEVLGIGRKDP